LSVGYNTLKFEENLVTNGGAKKGFLMTDKKLSQEIMDKLKEAWRKLFTNSEEKVVVLNDGLKFQEASESSVEMQLNENKQTNSSEICKIINVPESIIKGTASETDFKNGFKLGVMPIIRIIEAALNRDFLLEREKFGEEVYYWSIDTKEMLKGDIKSRYDAYKTGLDANFLQIDEVRYMEDLPEFGLDWIKLGLKDVLYNPKTGEIYTPNTGEKQNMDNEKEGDNDEDRNTK
jgi:HK97 family phage portal protein